jgi:hypothetical protein
MSQDVRLGVAVTVTSTVNIRARDGGLLGFFVNSATIVGLYDAVGTSTGKAILASATAPLGWNNLPVVFNNGLYVVTSAPITVVLAN